MAYQIRDWGLHFENNRTKELVRMTWVPVPNKHDGSGFTDLMARDNALALYGAWHLILQIASKCPKRGLLVRDGKPLSVRIMSRMVRCDENTMQEAFDACVEIGWIESVDDNPAPTCGVSAAIPQDKPEKPPNPQVVARPTTYEIPQVSAAISRVARARGTEGKGREGKGIEENNKRPAFAKSVHNFVLSFMMAPRPDGLGLTREHAVRVAKIAKGDGEWSAYTLGLVLEAFNRDPKPDNPFGYVVTVKRDGGPSQAKTDAAAMIIRKANAQVMAYRAALESGAEEEQAIVEAQNA